MMTKMYDRILRHLDNEAGATAVEYGMMVALIAAVIVTIVAALGTQVNTAFTTASNALSHTPPPRGAGGVCSPRWCRPLLTPPGEGQRGSMGGFDHRVG